LPGRARLPAHLAAPVAAGPDALPRPRRPRRPARRRRADLGPPGAEGHAGGLTRRLRAGLRRPYDGRRSALWPGGTMSEAPGAPPAPAPGGTPPGALEAAPAAGLTVGPTGGRRGEVGTSRVKRGMAEMLKGGVIMDVVTPGQARIAEDAGAVAVMALERVP